MKLMMVSLLLLAACGQVAGQDGAGTRSKPEMPVAPSSVPKYQPITAGQRVKWFAVRTAGPVSLLLAGPVSSGWGTLLNSPKEYGTHWEGFGKRYGMRLTGLSTGTRLKRSWQPCGAKIRAISHRPRAAWERA